MAQPRDKIKHRTFLTIHPNDAEETREAVLTDLLALRKESKHKCADKIIRMIEDLRLNEDKANSTLVAWTEEVIKAWQQGQEVLRPKLKLKDNKQQERGKDEKKKR